MKKSILIAASFAVASTAAFGQSNCVNAPINLSGSQMTLTSSGNKIVTKDQTYVYYSRRHPRRHEESNTIAAINDKYPSMPILLNSEKRVSATPESYNVTLSTSQNNVSVCPDSTLNLVANINVEKVSSYTGNYPNSSSDNKTYTKVSKRDYKMVARKMRKIKRNEDKIARKSGISVDMKSDKV